MSDRGYTTFRIPQLSYYPQIYIQILGLPISVLNWNSLKTDPSDKDNFEELCCQLARYEDVHERSTYVRLKPPDGGMECYWTLPDGTELGWQAKYFRSTPTSSQWQQIDESVRRAMDTHPNLKQYTICLSTDRSDSRTAGRKSFLDRWNDYVQRWKKVRDIEFMYWGSSEIDDKLSSEQQAGRHMYFFNEQLFSQRWFKNRCDEAIREAGPRYSARPNLELPISRAFETLGRTKKFHNEMKRHSREIQEINRYVEPPNSVSADTSKLTKLKATIGEIRKILGTTDKLEQHPINFLQLHNSCIEAREIIHNIVSELQRQSNKESSRISLPQNQTGNNDSQQNHLYQLDLKLSDLTSAIQDKEFYASNTGTLLVRGKAGVGKTHLFCDVTKQRVEKGIPTVLLYGGLLNAQDPKNTILNQLGLTCTFDNFLGALEAAGQARNEKALILIDALNESEGRNHWKTSLAGLVEAISRHPWVGLGISVRSSYESSTIPEGLVPEEMSAVEHYGFTYDLEGAFRIFFDENAIERPSVPVLAPEFSNPQFLVLLCNGLKNMEANRIPDELGGITSVYSFFLNSVNRKLSDSADFSYSEHERIVFRVVNLLVKCMIEKNRLVLSYSEAVQRLQNDPCLEEPRPLLRYLISEGVLREDSIRAPEGDRHITTFAYERLAENLFAQGLLNNIEGEAEIEEQCKNGVLTRYLAAPRRYRGLIDALSIQIPERFRKELAELYPDIIRSEIGRNSFLDSLMWRNPSSIGNAANSLIAKCLERKLDVNAIFIVLLTVSTNPRHPHNAEYLHDLLCRLEMGERDSIWSTFLHQSYSQQSLSTVRQYTDWAANSEQSSLVQESYYLASLAVAWFLTSSNRSLRDRSTKALTSLWSRQTNLAVRVLRKFDQCNDSYVLERLFCAAYGYAMKNCDRGQLEKLAKYTYSRIFSDGKPPPNILLRDYARKIVEYTLYKGISLNIEPNKLNPPYHSDWIESFPSKSDINELKKPYSDTDSKGALQIFFSLGWSGDFYRYIIGGNSNHFPWSCIPLRPNKIPRMKSLDQFFSKLNNDQRSYFANYISDSCKRELFRNRLTTNQKKNFDLTISPIIELLREQNGEDLTPDLQAYSRWMVQKVFALGWTRERFEAFDHDIALIWNRSNGGIERMGKKYQWIAYYELLARVSDNFEFIDEERFNTLGIYEGPWQLSDLRNIDPSLALVEPEQNPGHDSCGRWGDQSIYHLWDNPTDDVQWIKKTEDLPDLKSLIEISRDDGSTWLALGGSITLIQPVPADQEPYELPRRNVFLLLESCLTRKTNTNKLYNWSKGLEPHRTEFPEPPSVYNTFLGELYWDESILHRAYFDPNWIMPNGSSRSVPVRSLVSTYKYPLQASEYDHSSIPEITWRLPNSLLLEKMDLICKGDGTFVNSNGDIVAYDPSTDSANASVLLIRKEEFVKFLLENSYGIVWRWIGEKTTPGGSMAFGERWNGKLEISGSYKTANGKIIGVHSTRFIEPPLSRDSLD